MPELPCTYVTTGVPWIVAAYASASACMCASRPTNVVVMLGKGVPSAAIVQRIVTRHGVSERTARADLAKVRDRWSLEIAKDEPHRRAQLLALLDTVIAGAMADHAWSAAIAGCRALARVCGLDAPIMARASDPHVGTADRYLLDALGLTNA